MQECSDSAVIIHPLLADNLINRGRNLHVSLDLVLSEDDGGEGG